MTHCFEKHDHVTNNKGNWCLSFSDVILCGRNKRQIFEWKAVLEMGKRMKKGGISLVTDLIYICLVLWDVWRSLGLGGRGWWIIFSQTPAQRSKESEIVWAEHTQDLDCMQWFEDLVLYCDKVCLKRRSQRWCGFISSSCSWWNHGARLKVRFKNLKTSDLLAFIF